MNKFMDSKFGRELLFGIGAIVLVVLMTAVSVKKNHQREDLALLQVDFTEIMTKAKICFDQNEIVQDPSQGRQGKVFICSNQNVIEDTFPDLKNISRRELEYRYLSAEKCFGKKCSKKGEGNNRGGRINIGRGHKLVLSCNVAEGVCRTQ